MLSLVPLLALLAVPAPSESAGSAGQELAFGIDVARRGLWNEARFRFERAVALDPGNPRRSTTSPSSLEQQGEFRKAREAYEKALKLKPGNLYIQQNYDLFREADDKRNRKNKKTPAPNATPTP